MIKTTNPQVIYETTWFFLNRMLIPIAINIKGHRFKILKNTLKLRYPRLANNSTMPITTSITPPNTLLLMKSPLKSYYFSIVILMNYIELIVRFLYL